MLDYFGSPSLAKIKDLMIIVLGPERAFYRIAMIYGAVISLFSLAVPFSVQILITTLSNTAMQRPVLILSFVLFLLLCLYGALVALQEHVLELFKRRFYARMVGEIAWRNAYAERPDSPSRHAIINRYFDVMTVQYKLPVLITHGFAIALQAVIGLIIVSCYHPAFLLFNLVFVGLIYLAWRVYHPVAVRRVLILSRQKYRVAAVLEQQALPVPPGSAMDAEALLSTANQEVGNYLSAHTLYFKYSFRQMIVFLLIYAIASAGLLSIGGSLVASGQLTLGQLVAAELVLSAVFYGLSKSGEYLDYYYDLCAASEKLSSLLTIPVKPEAMPLPTLPQHELQFIGKLPVFDTIPIPRVGRTISRLLLVFVVLLVAFFTFTPWTQTSFGSGVITALNPDERTQPIHSLVKGRIRQWYVQDGSLVRKDDPIVEIIDNDPQLISRLQSERDAMEHKSDTMRLAVETAEINFGRQQALSQQGLASRKDSEQAKIRLKELNASYAQARADLNKIEVQLARQGTQIVRAPRDGYVMQITAGGIATQVKEGDILARFVPQVSTRAVELYVHGLDVPLLYPGRKVRLMFEGWPAVQFSGWPAVAVGTFAGELRSVDASVSPNGRFRVLVTEPANDPWPDDHFLRMGAKAQGWVLLNEVPLGFELWRKMNNFPPQYDASQTHLLKKPAKGAPDSLAGDEAK